jgi:hypothetical protein
VSPSEAWITGSIGKRLVVVINGTGAIGASPSIVSTGRVLDIVGKGLVTAKNY